MSLRRGGLDNLTMLPNELSYFKRASSVAGDSTAYTNFIARTSLTSPTDDTYINAYKAFLNGLTTDGLFNSDGTSNYFDALYILATKDEATSLLSLVSATYNATKVSVPTFTQNVGWVSPDQAGDKYLDTNFNPSTAGSPKYTASSAHLSVWNTTNASGGGAALGNGAVGTSGESNLFPMNGGGDNKFYSRLADSSGSGGTTISDPRGHLLGNRTAATGASNIQHYQNGSSFGTQSQNSGTVTSATVRICGANAGAGNDTHTLAAVSFGASLNSTLVGNFYTRLHTCLNSINSGTFP